MPKSDLADKSSAVLFEQFVEQARPVVVGNMVEAIEEIRPRLQQVNTWLLDDDLLTVAGVSFVEDAYTELLAWALYPPGEPDVANVCQRAWLKALGIEKASSIRHPVYPHTQFITAGGRPDLVMDYRDDGFVLAAELKTGSEEHETPKDGMQTKAYPRLVRKALALPKDFDVEMVYLTPSGLPAANERAINTTYHLLVDALASALDGHALSPQHMWSYSTIFTHFLRHASPKEVDGAKSLRDVNKLLSTDAAAISDDALLTDLSKFRSAIQLLAPGDDEMSDEFTGFDKAATLYAQNLPLIEETQSMFDENMLHFEEALHAAIKQHVPHKLFRAGKSKKQYRTDPRPRPFGFICLADDDGDPWGHALLALNLRDPSVAASQHLTLIADVADASEEQLRRLWKVPHDEELSGFCESRGNQDRHFFEVTVDISGDGLDRAGEQIAAVLKAMYKAENGRAAR